MALQDGTLVYGSQLITFADTGNTQFVADNISIESPGKLLERLSGGGIPVATALIPHAPAGTMTIQVPAGNNPVIPELGTTFALKNIHGTVSTFQVVKLGQIFKADAETKMTIEFRLDQSTFFLSFGTQPVSINSVGYIADDIEIDVPSTFLVRKDQTGNPVGTSVVQDIAGGRMTLQVPSSSAVPPIGASVTLHLIHGTGAGVLFQITKVGTIARSDSETKIQVEFKQQFSPNVLFHGSELVSIAGKLYVAENLRYDQPTKLYVRMGPFGEPNAQLLYNDVGVGKATLQLLSLSLPPIGGVFAIQKMNGVGQTVFVSKVSEIFRHDGEMKIEIDFRQKLT